MLSLKKIASSILLMAGIGFITVLIYRSWEQIGTVLYHANWPLLLLSAIVGILGMFATSVFFRHLLTKYGLDIPSTDVHRIFFFGQIAKYVPGKIWGIIYQATSLGRKGAGVCVTAANIDLMAISIIAQISFAITLIVAGISMYIAVTMFFLGMYITTLAACSSASGEIITWVITRVGAASVPKNAIEHHRDSKLYPVLAYYGVTAITGLLAYYLMLHAVFYFSFEETIIYIAYLMLSWVIGVFAFLVPAGIGVRELVFIVLGTYVFPAVGVDVLATIVLVSRFWQVFQDLSSALLVWMAGKLRGKIGTP